VKTSILPIPAYHRDETLEGILSRHVDSFYIDGFEASFDPSTGTLLGVFHADFFGACHFSKAVGGDLETDLKLMADLASDILERKQTEGGSLGFFREANRPVKIPQDLSFHFVAFQE
jgi:hypothetical protein